MSDAELAEFMKNHRRPDGSYELPVDGWDKLSKEERTQLAERLQYACYAPPLRANDAGVNDGSGPKNEPLPRIPRFTCFHLTWINLMCDSVRYHRTRTILHHKLDNNPLSNHAPYSAIAADAEGYQDMLRPWQDPSDGRTPWQAFERQLERWQDFRKWQNDNRGLEDETGFLDYVKSIKRYTKLAYTEKGCAERLAQVEADLSCLGSAWNTQQKKREEHRHLYRERGCNGLSDYEEAVKRRLEQHNFSRAFHLEEKPGQQDKLTTWIEYLNFEYWWLDRHTKFLEGLESGHDKTWQELVDTQMVKPHETQEYIRGLESAMQRATDEERAEKIVETHLDDRKCDSQDKSGKGSFGGNQTTQQPHRRFAHASYEYVTAEGKVARQGLLLQWVLEQIPLIEAELTQLAENELSKGKKRRHSEDDEHSAGRNQKRRKSNHKDSGSYDANPGVLEVSRMTLPEVQVVVDRDEAQSSRTRKAPRRAQQFLDISPKTVRQGLRRGARIAACQQASGVAAVPDTPLAGSHTRPRTKPARVSKPTKLPKPIPSTTAQKPRQ
ncbi:hypothetical protein PT974_01101 [Cladobotryum mycophilum]|uniref:Ankyrin 2,3/unc44 n=1 Tax=Cladobotryum mycophilum TaxID=491253 RepID=A0ABR0T3B4_9HYPO